MKKQYCTAFSLFEMSAVLLIISTIIVGIIRTNDMLIKSHLTTAQTLTTNSPVKDIDNLVLWYETSLESSFIDSEMVDGESISTWYDNNPNTPNKNHASQASTNSQPLFVEKVFNQIIPAIRFDGTNDYMDFDGLKLVNSSYTIFVVEQRNSDASSNYFIGGSSSSAGESLTMGYSSDTSIAISHQSTDYIQYTVSAYEEPTPTLHTASFNIATGVGKKYWMNGGSSVDASDSSQVTPLSNFADAAIGKNSTSNYYDGDIAEIIIFNRYLQTEEIQSIQEYLRKKYRLTLS